MYTVKGLSIKGNVMLSVLLSLCAVVIPLSGAQGDAHQKFLKKYTFPACESLKTHLQKHCVAIRQLKVNNSLVDIANQFAANTYTEIQLANSIRVFFGKQDMLTINKLEGILIACPNTQISECRIDPESLVEHKRPSCCWCVLFSCFLKPLR